MCGHSAGMHTKPEENILNIKESHYSSLITSTGCELKGYAEKLSDCVLEDSDGSKWGTTSM